MSDPATPEIAPGAARIAPMPDDNFGQRLGVALAVSIGVNILILQGAGTLAQSMARVPTLIPIGPVRLLPPVQQVPLDTIASPTPTAAGTPVPVATPVAQPTPTVRPRPQQVANAAVRRPRPETVRPRPTTQNSPRPATTPPPTRNFTARPTTSAAAAAVSAATARAATSERAASASAVSRTSNTSANPVEARNQSISTRTSTAASATAGTTPDLTTRTVRALGGGTTTHAVGARSSATQQFSAKSGGATQFATSAASGTPGTAGANPSATVTGRVGTGVGEAIGKVGALTPATVAPEAISTSPGNQRQLRTVAGVASRAVGANSVVTMKATAAAASASDFTFQSGGQIRPGTPTARQGGAGSAATSIVTGTPTVIASRGEYAVYAPVPETHGVIGVRGSTRAPIGPTVTNLRSKGSYADVASGAAIFASEGNATGTGVRGAVSSRTASSATGVGGGVSAKSGGGAALVSGVGEGGAGGRGTSVSAAGAGSGPGARGKAISAGGGAGGNARGGEGGVQGSDIGNGLGGAAKTGGGGGRTTVAGGAQGVGGVGGAKVSGSAAVGGAAGVNARQANARPIDVSDEEEALASQTVITQVPAQATKTEFDLPDDLRRQKFNGHMEIRVMIESNGSHTEELIKGTGNNDVDRAVLNWMRSWRWKPATQNSNPVRSSRLQKINLGVN